MLSEQTTSQFPAMQSGDREIHYVTSEKSDHPAENILEPNGNF